MRVDLRGVQTGVAEQLLDDRDVHAGFECVRGKGVPIPYNKDKTRNPSKIKGFRACPYSFSKKNTLRSRSKGGVER